MKKKLLFVIPSLHSGNAERGLVALLQVMDYAQYDVDLFLFRREGLFLPLIPPEVRVLDAGERYRIFEGETKAAVRHFLRKGQLLTALRKALYAHALSTPRKSWMGRAWRRLAPILPRLKGYDTAIAFLEETATYYTVDRVRAGKKIAFLHTDYDYISQQKWMDTSYYKKIDTLVCVAAAGSEKVEQYFPFLQGKTLFLPNLVFPSLIRDMARESIPEPPGEVDATILMIGRLFRRKRIDRAIRACALLRQRGLTVRWFVIGIGPLERELRLLSRTLGVEDLFILLGEQVNPYPFMQMSDFYVQTSRVEGTPVAIDEAKGLAKPVIVTNTEFECSQIRNGENGLIVPPDPVAFAEAIERLIREPKLRETIVRNLQQEHVGAQEEIQKLFDIL